MRKDLDDLLCARYPKIFEERQLSAEESSMSWGFQCGDGWFALIDTLCRELQSLSDHHEAPQAVAVQVKQKFGELRFLLREENDLQTGMIQMARAMSDRICEACGNAGTSMINERNWSRTCCPVHVPEGYKPVRGTSGEAMPVGPVSFTCGSKPGTEGGQ